MAIENDAERLLRFRRLTQWAIEAREIEKLATIEGARADACSALRCDWDALATAANDAAKVTSVILGQISPLNCKPSQGWRE